MLGLSAAGAAGAALTTLGPLAGVGQASESSGRDSHRSRRVPVDSISIQLYTLAALMAADVDGTLEGLAEIGFTKVEHAGITSGLTARQFHNTLRCTSPRF